MPLSAVLALQRHVCTSSDCRRRASTDLNGLAWCNGPDFEPLEAVETPKALVLFSRVCNNLCTMSSSANADSGSAAGTSAVVTPEHVQIDDLATDGVRKIRKTQTLDGRPRSVEEVFITLRQRQTALGSNVAAWWRHVIVKKQFRLDKEQNIKYEVCVVECKDCGKQHGAKTLNPANFAKSHFQNHTQRPVCFKSLNRGM